MTFKAVIFDLDGTLVELKLDYKTESAEVIHFLIEQGIPPSIPSMEKGMFGALRSVEIYMTKIGKKEEVKRIKETVLSMADRYELQAARKTSLIPGVLEALKTLKAMKLKMALFTIDGEKATRYILKRFRIGRFFDAVITRDSVSAVKPDPTHLEAALNTLNVKPHEALVVGDSTLDMQCATRLKVLAVGVITGISTPEKLIAAGASYLASASAEIPFLVEQINKKT